MSKNCAGDPGSHASLRETKAYCDGRAAAVAGADISDNPHAGATGGSGSPLLTNWQFDGADSTGWLLQDGWSHDTDNDMMTCSGAQVANSNLNPSPAFTSVVGQLYYIEYDVDIRAGAITRTGFGVSGPGRSSVGRQIYRETVMATTAGNLFMQANATFEGDVHYVKLQTCAAEDYAAWANGFNSYNGGAGTAEARDCCADLAYSG